MLRLNILMMIGNINYINKFLFKNNQKNLKKLKSTEIERFIKWYLSCKYEENVYNKYAIYFYLDEAAKKLGPKKVEELVIKSNYFESKPVEEISCYFKVLHNLELPELKKIKGFRTYLTSKITKSYDLIELINNRVDLDYDYAFKSLVEVQNVHYLIIYGLALIRQDNKKRLAEAIINSEIYSLEELKKFLLETRMNTNIIVELFTSIYKNTRAQEDKDKIIDTFNSLIETNQRNLDNDIINDNAGENFIDGYKGYAHGMSLLKDMPLAMKNDLARKLIENKNYKFIYEWFLNDINCEYNYNMIDALVLESEDVVANTLLCVNDKYVEYAVKKLINRDREFVTSVMEYIFIRAIDFDIVRMDKVLTMVYTKYGDFKLSKEAAFNLIRLKSKYTPKYISEYEFTEVEKEKIKDIYDWTKIFLVIYESYINGGNKTQLLLDLNETGEMLNNLRLERRVIKGFLS